jgi:hypothetical protein
MTTRRIEPAKASIYQGSKHQRLSICGKSITQKTGRESMGVVVAGTHRLPPLVVTFPLSDGRKRRS